jgi:hypothetical protein
VAKHDANNRNNFPYKLQRTLFVCVCMSVSVVYLTTVSVADIQSRCMMNE